MISMHNFNRVRELSRDGLKPSEIASELNLNRKTVAKYLASNSPPQYPKERAGRTREDSFNPFIDRAKLLLANPNMSNVEIYEIIKDEGYLGSERTVQRRLHEIKSELPKERFFEQEYAPGEQSQFDFKESVTLPFRDGPRVVHFVFGTLPCSDKFFIKSYPRKHFECFIDGIHSFFEFIGGMTKNIRIDNLSPCVSKVHKGSRRTYTASFERAIVHYGFGVLPCSPGRGNEKGDVERDIRTHAGRMKNLIENQGTVFSDFDDLNDWIKCYIEKRTSETIHAGFEIEKKELLPLPRRDEEVLCRVEECSSTAYGIVRVGDYAYSVPDCAIKEKCTLVAGAYDLKIYQKSPRKLVATHSRMDGDSILIEHILPSLIRKPHAMIRWAHRDILFLNASYKSFYLRLQSICKDDAEKIFLKCVNLVQLVAASEISAGMEILMNEGMHENLYEELRELLLGVRRPGNVLDISSKLNQQKLSPNLKDFDELIPKGG